MKFHYTLCAALAGILLLTATNSCKKPDEGVDLIIETGFSEATVSFQFVDAVTGQQIGLTNTSENVEIEVLGPDKAYIVDNASGSAFNTEAGFITLAVEKDVTPSESNVIDFHVNATAAGYIPRHTSVRISKPGTQHFVIEMVKVTDTPDGVGAVVNSTLTSNSSGTTQSALSVSTGAMTTTFEDVSAEFTVPVGTVLKDKNNLPVNGTITTTVVYFSNEDPSALLASPTGPDGQLSGNDDGFAPGGVVSTQMRGNGKEVKNFGSSVQMKMEIPATTTDGSGNPIVDGVGVPVWSYNTDAGEWVQEGTTTIEFNSTTGKFEAEFDMTHLSYWMVAWPLAKCTTGATVTISSPYTGQTTNGYVLVLNASGRPVAVSSQSLTNGSSFSLAGLPVAGGPFTLNIYSQAVDITNLSASLLATATIPNLCSGSYNVTVNDPNVVTVTATVNGTCADKPGQIIRPTVTVFVQEVGHANWNYIGEMVNGHISTNALKMGKTYKVAVSLGGQFIIGSKQYTVDELEYTFDEVIDPYICNLIN